MLINRPSFIDEIRKSIRNNPVTAIMGPRQCGKTTLARSIAKTTDSIIFDLEDPTDFELLLQNPKMILQQQKGLVVIDEVQRNPDMFRLLRVLADEADAPRKFLILGSASPDLIQKSSESLAGRIGFVNLTGFNLMETGIKSLDKLWKRGGFPKSFLGTDEEQSFSWRENFIQTFLERDISNFGFNIPAVTLRRFWLMLAHYHGQIWNGAEFARSLGVSEPTVKRYLDILTGTYMIRQLQPWHENLKKRQVKAPKVYIRDSGIVHALLGMEADAILTNVKSGASWEGFIIEQLLSRLSTRDFYYWRTHTGIELDLMVLKSGKRLGFEVTFSETPKITRSMLSAREDLKLDQLFIIYNGHRLVALEHSIIAVPASNIVDFDFLSSGCKGS
ncbi:MAG: putative ATPase (AAA+ superfamily) [Bacteroidetes bacterium HLUCCA01]|nr:MAG: putative ATPase (AAA+ superfamily) [Bacteroidetes bacterium HLUCCA01]